jgi:hypothetical protein
MSNIKANNIEVISKGLDHTQRVCDMLIDNNRLDNLSKDELDSFLRIISSNLNKIKDIVNQIS